MKSERNKTIELSAAEQQLLLKEVLTDGVFLSSEIVDRVMLGNCLNAMDKLPSGIVDLMIVDPPYNLTKAFGEEAFRSMSDAEYAEYSREWLKRAMRLLKPTATVYVCNDWRGSVALAPILKEFFQVRNRITWQREKGRAAANNWKNAHEDIWFCTVGKEFTFNPEAVQQRRKVVAPYREQGAPKDWEETEDGNFRNTAASNFWDDITVPYWSMAENTPHPTQKPEKLLAKLILASSNEGDLVFDPFMGTGTTCVTARKLNRHYFGIEINAEYVALAQYRLHRADNDRTIQGYSDGVFWERNSAPNGRKGR